MKWLDNFEAPERGLARDIASAITLVSHTEFERNLIKLILHLAASVEGVVALYGAREVTAELRASQLGEETSLVIDATPRGSDIGSEGRIASIIRNLCNEHSGKLLNHPSQEQLHAKSVRTIIVVDDFIGSGKRCKNYIDFLWQSPTVRSWHSYKLINFMVASYSATAAGMRNVRRHPARPDVHLARHCPTIDSLHWPAKQIKAAKKLCLDYAAFAHLGRMYLGFERTGALLVFEHGCPNNVPAIFWATSKKEGRWSPLFPAKRVASDVASVFPAEITHKEPVHALLEAGQKRLAERLTEISQTPLTSQQSVVLALFAQGKRRVETVATATGLKTKDAEALIELCIEAGWISPRKRITDAGHAELRGICSSRQHSSREAPALGNDVYYPVALRNHDLG